MILQKMNRISFTRENKDLGFAGAEKLIRKAINAALEEQKIKVPCEVSVLLTDDAGIQTLNREFRNVDASTDVLSFPANELEAGAFDPAKAEKHPKSKRVILGDMALSLEHAFAQGKEFGHGTKREIQYLTVHSVLHLLGYDHVDEGEGKREMRSREKEIMARIEGMKEK